MRVVNRRRHQHVGFIRGKAKHQTLITRTLVGFIGLVRPQRDIGGLGGIDGARVIEVCGQAVFEFPENGRYWVQLGRGYLKLDRGQAMLEAFEKARELQYPVAWFALAVVYHTGNGIPQADLSLAETLYQDAYRRGVGYAALGLARLYDEPESPFFDLEKSDVWQSRFDALFNRLG